MGGSEVAVSGVLVTPSDVEVDADCSDKDSSTVSGVEYLYFYIIIHIISVQKKEN
jgi:hypothetical protein